MLLTLTNSNEIPNTLSGHTSDIHTLAFSPGSRWLASASEDLTVRLWDAASGPGLSLLTGHTNRINSVAFSPDGTMLASTYEELKKHKTRRREKALWKL